MIDKHRFKEIKQNVIDAGKNEIELRKEVQVEHLWDMIQEEKTKMYEAIRQATLDVSKPFKETIQDLEEQYALILKLSS